MSLIWTPQRRAAQPQGVARIRREFDASGSFALIGNSVPPHVTYTSNGYGTSSTGAAGKSQSWPITGVVGDTQAVSGVNTNNFTAICVFSVIDTSLDRSLIDCDLNTNRAWQWFVRSTGTVRFLRLNTTLSSFPNVDTVGTVSAGKVYVAIAVSDGNNFRLQFGAEVLTGSVTGTAQSYKGSSHSGAAALGTGFIQSYDFSGDYYLRAVIPRTLSVEQCHRIIANPWDLFEPMRQPLYAVSAASGLPTLSAPQMTGITTTGGYPRVSYVY